jgi:hypothetical protein
MKVQHFSRVWLVILAAWLMTLETVAQENSGFHYQAVARNGSSEILAQQELTIRIGILDPDGMELWVEEHPVVTGNLGIFDLDIGLDPEKRVAGSAQEFSDIDWSIPGYLLNVQVKEQGGSFTDLGSSPILSVPYALMSDDVRQPMGSFSIRNDGDVPPDSALFEVLRSDGYPVFAVYEDGVWVYTDTAENKARKGGFSVGGYSKKTKGNEAETYMRVTSDSIRFYVDYNAGKGRTGGYAISGRNPVTGGKVTYLFLTPRNIFMGENSGLNNTTGMHNTFIGYHAGEYNTEGSENVILGYVAGNQNETGVKNVFIGDSAGYNNRDGSWNVFLGRSAGLSNTSGKYNVIIGGEAGYFTQGGSVNLFLGMGAGAFNVNGHHNCFLGQFAGYFSETNNSAFIGNQAGAYHESGDENIFIGNLAGQRNNRGRNNVFIGKEAGRYGDSCNFNVAIGNLAGENLLNGEMNVLIGNQTGASIINASHNTCIGSYAGMSNETGSGNVFIGSWTGMENQGSGNVFIGNETGRSLQGSNLLVIDNGDFSREQSLIVGQFDEDKLRMNAIVGINTEPDSAYSIKTAGNIEANDVTTTSDARFKTDIQTIENALELVMSLEGVHYRWNRTAYPDRGFDEGLHYGFVAQDLEKVIPDLVCTDSDGYKSVNYQKINTILVEAVKEQQKQLEEKEQEIIELENRLERVEAALFR